MDKKNIKKHLTSTFLLEDKKPKGLSSTEKVQADSKKFNNANQKEVAKEMKDYEKSLEKETEPVKYENDKEQQEYHDEMEIMNGLEMNRFQNDPGKAFKERAEKAIAGDASMGNSPDYANVVTADQAGFTGPDFGKNLVKKIKSSTAKRDKASELSNKNKTSVSGTDFKDGAMNNKSPKSTAISENKKNKMKRLVFKKDFKGVGNALNLIPETYKVNGKQFHMTDGNEKYEIRWEGSLTEGRAIVLKASDKNLMNEDMENMKRLMGYKSQDTLGTVKGSARLDENARFNDILGKTKNLMTEMTGGYGFSGEGNLEGNTGIEESNSSTSTSEISSQIKKEIPNLVNNPNIEKIANEILKDPKAIEDLKQFVSMGKTNEDEGVPVVDSSFIGDAISLGIEKASSLNEFKKDYAYRQNDGESSTEKNSEDIGGKIGGLVGAMVGGAYLADKLVPNPMVMGKIASNIGYVNQMMLENDPMVIAALGALAGAVISVVAYKVFKKKKNQTDEGMDEYGVYESETLVESDVVDAIKDTELAKKLGAYLKSKPEIANKAKDFVDNVSESTESIDEDMESVISKASGILKSIGIGIGTAALSQLFNDRLFTDPNMLVATLLTGALVGVGVHVGSQKSKSSCPDGSYELNGPGLTPSERCLSGEEEEISNHIKKNNLTVIAKGGDVINNDGIAPFHSTEMTGEGNLEGMDEETTVGSDDFKWFDSVNIPIFQDYSGLQNMDSNAFKSPDMNGYIRDVRQNVDSRDWGMYFGDKVMSYLKDKYMLKINSIGDASVREFLKDPKVIDASTKEEHVKQTIEANKFIASIPDIEDSKYLGNAQSFFNLISTPVVAMFDECIDRNFTHLLPLVLPYIAYTWKRNVVDNMGRMGKK